MEYTLRYRALFQKSFSAMVEDPSRCTKYPKSYKTMSKICDQENQCTLLVITTAFGATRKLGMQCIIFTYVIKRFNLSSLVITSLAVLQGVKLGIPWFTITYCWCSKAKECSTCYCSNDRRVNGRLWLKIHKECSRSCKSNELNINVSGWSRDKNSWT